ncbi:hypothetical protein B0H34DRAFT_808799 [Crassisporium funariophilum]|nr:hypothetical protein B0H34DRAFT_808799 [Crassisporium funariophilum]
MDTQLVYQSSDPVVIQTPDSRAPATQFLVLSEASNSRRVQKGFSDALSGDEFLTEVDDLLSTLDTDNVPVTNSEISTPLTHSGRTYPTSNEAEIPEETLDATRKKKKKKSKKSAESQGGGVESESRDEADAEGSETRLPPLLPPSLSVSAYKQRDRGYHGLGDFSPPESSRNTFSMKLLNSLSALPLPEEAWTSQWLVRCRIGFYERLRALAVQKLALAYKADEIASSVMVMQGGSVFDDVAKRVLKEKIDSQTEYALLLSESIRPGNHSNMPPPIGMLLPYSRPPSESPLLLGYSQMNAGCGTVPISNSTFS